MSSHNDKNEPVQMDRSFWRAQGIEACLDRMQLMGDQLHALRSSTVATTVPCVEGHPGVENLALPDDVKKRVGRAIASEMQMNWQSDDDVIDSFGRIAALAYLSARSATRPSTCPIDGLCLPDKGRCTCVIRPSDGGSHNG